MSVQLATNKPTAVSADLQNERNKCTFVVEEFAEWWHNGADGLRLKREQERFVLTNPELNDATPTAHLSHKQRYEEAVRKGTIVMDKIRRLMNKHTPEDIRKNYLNIMYQQMTQFTGMLGAGSMSDGNPLGVHFGMFLPTIMGQGTDEQQNEWLMRAWRMELIGTYVQTELGHGTFLRGLQTTATFDAATDEFVLNTPTVSAYKWWPGGLGHTVNYAVVMAQLYIDDKHHGLHPFMVQLRDSETWQPLAGIHVGEIGPKFGFHGVNNGFLGFSNVRIARSAMLARNARVYRDGRFEQSPATAVLTYGTMIFVRVSLARDMCTYLSRAATIVGRYSAVRRQSPIDPKRPEPQIIEHVTQQRKVLTNVAFSVVLRLIADRVWTLYGEILDEMRAGNLRRMPEIHTLACGLKAVSTGDAAIGVEQLRMACGGHGYMEGSALPAIYGSVTAACTYDGENTVMLLQAARYLAKSWQRATKGVVAALPETVAYLSRAVQGKSVRWAAAASSVGGIAGALETVAANKIRLASEHTEQRVRAGQTREAATNATSIELAAAAEAHVRAYLVRNAVEQTADIRQQVSAPLATVIQQLIELYAIETCERMQADLIRFAGMTDADVRRVRERLETLLASLRPNTVGIVDGFDHTDAVLCSTLGAYDGRVYERLFAEAQSSPLNREGIAQTFEQYVKPMLRANL